jgi:hypothetical protein
MKKILPGIGTLSERKKFAVFHAVTLIFSPILAIAFMFLFKMSNPFTNVGKWLLCSIFLWNLVGSIRFHNDIDNFFIARGIGLILVFTFPLFYLYNLVYIFWSIKNK